MGFEGFSNTGSLASTKVCVIIVATGYQVLQLDNYGEYSYHDSRDIITSMELERITNAAGPTGGKLVRPSDGRLPKKITFIQCVGSRDITHRGKPYCSKICCMYTAKHAILIKEKHPEIDVEIFYIDVRTAGKGFDEFYRRAVEVYGVRYIKGQVGKIIDEGTHLQLQAVDMLAGNRYDTKTDLVVLAAAVVPSYDTKELSQKLLASVDGNHFFAEAHPKLRPVECATAGIFLAGMCHGSKDIPETVAQASAAACKAIGILAKDRLITSPCIAKADEKKCSGCAVCKDICPYSALTINDAVITVNAALCQGCGGCAAACPSGAMDLQGFSHSQVMAEVDALCL
jgi:heterodisulfide reductase subunit A